MAKRSPGRRALLVGIAIVVAFLVGAGAGAFAYVWHANEKILIREEDRNVADTAMQTIQRLCTGLASDPPPPLTGAERAELHQQVEALAGVIDRNPDYWQVFRGASHDESRVGWLPQVQFELFELARCHAVTEYRTLMSAALGTI